MLGKTTLFALLGAVAVSASELHSLMARDNLFTRQISAASIPSACQSGCASALTIYQACTTGDTTTCLSVCQSSNFASFTSCLQCIVNNSPGASATDVSTLNTALQQLSSACQAAGSPVASTSLGAPSGGASGSASRVVSGSASGTTSAIGTISAGQGPTSTSRASSASGLAPIASSLSSGLAAAASSSRASTGEPVAAPRGLGAMLVGAVGVVAGAALVF